VVKSPGISPDIPVVVEALRRGAGLADELEIGWLLVPTPTVAITGTNGKSTTSALLVEVLAAHGLEPTLAGNTEFGPALSELALTEPPRSVVAEVSSYQAENLAALDPEAAVFTNLSPEHLYRYGGMEAYGAAKRRLFVRGEWCVGLASVNVDDELGARLAAEIGDRGGRVVSYGTSVAADYRIDACHWDLRHGEVRIAAPDRTVDLETRLPGRHNAYNVAAALAAAEGLGLAREPTLAALAGAAPVRGRFEYVQVDRPFDVVVDFAIAPDSIVNVLETARAAGASRGGRVIVVQSVMGMAGPVVGPESGAAARRLSDHLILSASSYRGEARLVPLERLKAGACEASGGKLEIVLDRRRAISHAFASARPGDVIVILGRGATAREATDARGGFIELDDRQLVRELA
jgi:UDP-N-acetylmuramoyl-L-alanyl-D-glutamate--2,6-diaminopimelate ligase